MQGPPRCLALRAPLTLISSLELEWEWVESPCKSLSRDYLCGLNVREQVGHTARAWPGSLWERLGLQSDCVTRSTGPNPCSILPLGKLSC